MADDWRKKLEKFKKSLKPPPPTVIRRAKGNSKQSTTREPKWKKVDPKATWSEGRAQKTDESKRRSGAEASRLPTKPVEKGGPPFNIGIDFGTSGMKVCVRPPGEDIKIYVVGLDRRANAESAACPSTVTVLGGRIWFGGEAEERSTNAGAQVFRQLKICVACEVGIRPEVPVLNCRCKVFDGGRCSAMFDIAGARSEVLASDLVILLLAWTMRVSRHGIPSSLTGTGAVRTTYSVSAPLDQIDAGAKMSGEYARIIFQAWRLSDGIEQGMALETALSWISLVQQEELPAIEDRCVELCAESAAIVAGYAMSPEMEEGQYAVIDIGAWTTEMSFFRYSEVGRVASGRPTRAFHAARSYRTGANQIDDRCAGYLGQMYCDEPNGNRDLVETVRRQRETVTFGCEPISVAKNAREVTPRRSALEFSRDMVAEVLARRFQDTLKAAYEKEKLVGFWEGKLRILFAGGGSLDDVLISGFRHRFILDVQGVPRPSNLIGLPAADDYRRFLVAYGLSHGSARWPKDLFPSQTIPFELRKRRPPSSDDLGYGR